METLGLAIKMILCLVILIGMLITIANLNKK